MMICKHFVKKYSILLIAIFFFCSCSKKDVPDLDEKLNSFSETVQHDLAMKKLHSNDFAEAATLFEELALYSRSSQLVADAKIFHAYSLFKSKQFDEAGDVLDSFILQYPTSKYLDYVYYLQGLCYQTFIRGSLFDLSLAVQAKQKFKKLIVNFPNSKYVPSAMLRIKIIDELLAERELLVGIYYLDHLNPIAALTRFRYVYDNYSNSSRYQESIFRIFEAFYSMGLEEESQQYFDLLVTQFPTGYWTNYAKNIYV